MSRTFRLILLAVAGALIAPAPAAHAKSGPCLPDYPHAAQCTVWEGKVRYVDDGPTKELLIASGWADRPLPREELHDLLFDPAEAANVADDPAYSEVRAELAGRLEAWMRETADPLLAGDVAPPPGAEVTDPDQVSPAGAPVAHR